MAADATADSVQPQEDCENYCHTFFDTLHATPSSTICRAPAHTGYFGIPSEVMKLLTTFAQPDEKTLSSRRHSILHK